MNYIDQNPVVAGLSAVPAEWKASGAYYKANCIEGLVDRPGPDTPLKLLSPIPPAVSRLLPPAQLQYIMQYTGVYKETIDHLYKIVQTIPKIGDTMTLQKPPIYFHYFSEAADYFISEYDGENIMWGKVRFNAYPAEVKYQKFILSNLKNNQFIKLDFSWE